MAKREFPIHMAVREGHAEVVQLPLQAGAGPSQSRYTYNSWDKLLAIAEERVYGKVQALLVAALREGDAAVAHSQFLHELMGLAILRSHPKQGDVVGRSYVCTI